MQENGINQKQVNLVEEKLKLENRFKNGAGWFFWIAGLSLVNSIILLVGGNWNFLIGLGLTQLIAGIASEVAKKATYADSGAIIKFIAFAIDLLIAGVFVAFGVLARKGYRWSFLVGMILYTLDGAIFLLVPDFLSIGFHLFALFGIYGGLQAHIKLSEIKQYDINMMGNVENGIHN
jgi:hypothetical protein